jgi:glucose-6-phosphate 1-epimerase
LSSADILSVPLPSVANYLGSTSRISMVDFEGMPALKLQAVDGAQVTVLVQGAQVASWRDCHGRERLYLSENATFAKGQAVRGGIPVVFPQFDTLGPLTRHGFAREQRWRIVSAQPLDPRAAVLQLEDNDTSRAVWPHGFRAELRVAVGGMRLDVEFKVENTGAGAFDFAAALHSYFAVDELDGVRLCGVEACRYVDRIDGREAISPAAPLLFDREINRIYRFPNSGVGRVEALSPLLLEEPSRALRIEQQGFPEAVVWNPGKIKSARIADLPPLGFRRFVCVEAAAVNLPIRLRPGESWSGRQVVEALR